MEQPFGIIQTVAGQEELRQNETAELFDLASMRPADASIVVRGAKFDTPIDLWRPESAAMPAVRDHV